jgi:hypothetical protein
MEAARRTQLTSTMRNLRYSVLHFTKSWTLIGANWDCSTELSLLKRFGVFVFKCLMFYVLLFTHAITGINATRQFELLVLE